VHLWMSLAPQGALALYRRRMLHDVGLFDESFFAYLEDVDLAWRAQLRRWRTVLSPDAVVYHAVMPRQASRAPPSSGTTWLETSGGSS